MKKIILSIALTTQALLNIYSQSVDFFYSPIRLQNPQNWKSDNGKITKTSLAVTPKGLYSQVDLELTFAAYNPSYFDQDTLELTFGFQLPFNSFMTDSWLWMNGIPERALLIDYNTANATYEGIVKRRRDPSILTTYGNGYYNLRIYPMIPTESRKVKLSYMVLNRWSLDKIYVPLPVNLLGGGYGMEKVVPDDISFDVYANSDWKNARLCKGSGDDFFVSNKQYLVAFQQNDDFSLVFDSPLKNGVYSKIFETDGKGYFEMAFLPSQILDLQEKGTFTHFDLHTSIKNGITFEKTYLESELENPYSETPILQVGSYKGNGKLVLTAAGELNSNVYSKATEVTSIASSDTVVKKVWTSLKIKSLENRLYGYYNFEDSLIRKKTIKEIKDLSIKNRILSRFTALLALEPGIPLQECDNCPDNGGVFWWGAVAMSDNSTTSLYSGDKALTSGNQSIPKSSTAFTLIINKFNVINTVDKSETDKNLSVNIYPNPAINTNVISIDITNHADTQAVKLKVGIINSFGKTIKSIEGINLVDNHSISLNLHKENIQPGIYSAIVYKIDGSIITTKKFIIL